MPDSIVLRNISKTYSIPSIFPWKSSKKTEALNNVSLSCPEKKVTCLLGPNGAGKTTIMKILAGLVIPDTGTIGISGPGKKESGPKIGFVTQNERSFYWRLTGRQNLDFYASLYNLNGRRKKEKISEVLAEIGMGEEADKPFRLYSAGMRQKLHIARALLCDPDILLLDEPTTHIDPIAQENILGFIKNDILKNRKSTVLLCTHNLNEAQMLSDKIVLLDKGSIIAEGDISSLRSKINPNLNVIMEFSRMPKKGWEKGLPVEVLKISKSYVEIRIRRERIIPELIKAAVSSGGDLVQCRKSEESLLEIFTRLTSGSAR